MAIVCGPKNFKNLTMGHHLVMGRKTYESLGRPLPGRHLIVLSSQLGPSPHYLSAHTMQEALAFAKNAGDEECFIAGGGKVYTDALAYADRLYLTRVNYDGPADAFFPELALNGWNLVRREPFPDAPDAPKAALEVYDRQS